jgi:plasmid stabilization system protein ParE
VSYPLVVAPRAEADLRESFLWSEKRSPGLGHDFIRCVEARFELISRSPQLFRKRFGLYRLAATQRFPYAIYFIWDEANAAVAVRRVLHFKQDAGTRL